MYTAMNFSYKKLIVSFLFFLTLSIQAQEVNRSDFSVTLGGINRIDPSDGATYGFHLGGNWFKANSQGLGWDSQLAMNFTKPTFTNSILLTFMVLGGGRYYFIKGEGKTKAYFNFLAGFALEADYGDDYIEHIPDVGYSVGVFLEKSKLLFGLSVESAENLVLKVGFRF